MAIEGIIGRPGTGKSYELTRRAIAYADRDRIVFSNYPIIHENIFMFEPDQLLDLPPGLVVLDEAHLWFPARMSMKLPMSWLTGMSQTRHKGWDLIWAAQHESRIDRAIRDVTEWMTLCRTFGTIDNHPWLFLQRSWEPEEFRKKGRAVGFGIHRFDKRVATAYDTHVMLKQADHTRSDDDVYADKANGGGKRAAGRNGRGGSSVLDGVFS